MTMMILKMENNSFNSGGECVFFEMAYSPSHHSPEHLKHVMNSHPVTVKYREMGYVGPVVDSQYLKSWEQEYLEMHEALKIPRLQPRFVTIYKESIVNLLRVKELYDAGMVIFESHPHLTLQYATWQAEVFKQNDRNNKEKTKNEMED